MVSRFKSVSDFEPVIGWELYQVTLDKYHVMFLFNNGWNLMNVAAAFTHRSASDRLEYTFDIYGERAELHLTRLLREKVTEIRIPRPDRLTLIFSNRDELDIHDDPSHQSWWFIPVDDPLRPKNDHPWSISDTEPNVS